MKLTLAKYTTAASLLLTGVHYEAKGVTHLEEIVVNKYAITQDYIVGRVATKFGYELPVKVSNLTTNQLLEKEALAVGVNPKLAYALMMAESGGDQYALSPAGAIGYLQVMPENAKAFGYAPGHLYEPVTNFKAGMAVLSYFLNYNKGDVVIALQMYNGGHKNWQSKESVNHAKKVLARLAADTTI